MAKILFASNNIAHFPGVSSGSVVGTFDATRVPYSLALSNFQIAVSPKFIPTTGDVSWFHFRTYAANFSSSIVTGSSGILFEAFDAANNRIVRLARKNSTALMDIVTTLYNGTTSSVLNNTIPMIDSKVNFVDVKLTVTALLISVEVFINGASSALISFGTNPNGFVAPSYFTISPAFVQALAGVQHFSEIIVSDSDTRNARLNLLRPASGGALSDWDGLLTTLADDDTTSGLTALAAGARETMVMTPYVGATNISNFVAASLTTRGQNSPTKLKHTVRLSGTNYDGAEIPLANSLQYSLTDFPINPATSLPWVSSDLSAIETGFLSVA